jgi:hypothetical protein
MTAKLAPPLTIRHEPRAAGRHSCAVPTTCQPPSAWCKDPWPAIIRDISTGGLSLTLNRRFERGSGLAIELPNEDGTSATVLATVARVDPCPEGGWLLSCDFISELSEEEVQLVLNFDPASHSTLSVGEEPSRPEAVPEVKGVLFQAKFRLGEVLRWYVKRLDAGSAWPIERGQVICVRVGGVPADTPPLEMTVRDCRRFGSYWILDGRLLGAPPEVVLRALRAPTR